MAKDRRYKCIDSNHTTHINFIKHVASEGGDNNNKIISSAQGLNSFS